MKTLGETQGYTTTTAHDLTKLRLVNSQEPRTVFLFHTMGICREDRNLSILIRQEGSRIYKLTNNPTEELAYDFGREERDTMFIDDLTILVVDKVGVVRVNGVERHCLRINWISEFYEKEMFVDIWVEGIGGATTSPALFNSWASSSSGMMQSCVQDGVELFTWDDFFTDGVTNSIVDTRTKRSSETSDAFCDLQGRCLSSPPAKGIYIQDGKKQVVR